MPIGIEKGAVNRFPTKPSSCGRRCLALFYYIPFRGGDQWAIDTHGGLNYPFLECRAAQHSRSGATRPITSSLKPGRKGGRSMKWERAMRPESPVDLGSPSTPQRSSSTLLLLILLIVVFCLHSALEFLLYFGEVVGHWPPSILFAVPTGLALAAYARLFRRWTRARVKNLALRIVLVSVLTFVATCFSHCGSILVAINAYRQMR